MTEFRIAWIAATVLCTLVAGLVFTFAVVVMPGIRRLDAGGFIRAFQVMDGIIQESQPFFVIVWLGSVVSILAAVVLGFRSLTGMPLALVVTAGVLYLGAVQLPTFLFNIPLNNNLQRLTVETMNDTELRAAREAFEAPWVRWNAMRTVFAVLTSVLLTLAVAGTF